MKKQKNILLNKFISINKLVLITVIIYISTIYTVIYTQSINRTHGSQWAYNMDMDYLIRFEEIESNGVAILKDKLTGLKWEKYPPENSYLNYQNAVAYCSSKGYGFRIPNIYELRTLISLTNKNSNNAYSQHPNIKKRAYHSSTKNIYMNNQTTWYLSWFMHGNIEYTSGTPRNATICIQD